MAGKICSRLVRKTPGHVHIYVTGKTVGSRQPSRLHFSWDDVIGVMEEVKRKVVSCHFSSVQASTQLVDSYRFLLRRWKIFSEIHTGNLNVHKAIRVFLKVTMIISKTYANCELNYHDQKIHRKPTHNIREHWTAVSTWLGLISSVYRNLHPWRSNQLYNWATSSYRTQVTPNQLVMVIARPNNLSCKLHPCSFQRTRSPPNPHPEPRLPKKLINTLPRNYYASGARE